LPKACEVAPALKEVFSFAPEASELVGEDTPKDDLLFLFFLGDRFAPASPPSFCIVLPVIVLSRLLMQVCPLGGAVVVPTQVGKSEIGECTRSHEDRIGCVAIM
jgi:hypothetical protein